MALRSKGRMVPCPHCGKLSEWSTENLFRPFCSERCKMIDFGQWASESYRIPIDQAEAEQPDKNGE